VQDFILLMHADSRGEAEGQWPAYLERLASEGRLRGGSAIGAGETFRRSGPPAAVSTGLTGFIRVCAADLDDARTCLVGNPVYEAGGTVEIRLLPEDG
jgi:hypothetical protein